MANRRKGVRKRRKPTDEIVIAVDGEGQGRDPHLYTYMAAADEHGTVLGEVEDRGGLATRVCLDFLLDLPASKCFGYAFHYDLSKMLKDLPVQKLYDLFHEDTRRILWNGREILRPVYWADYKLNYIARKLSIQRVQWVEDKQLDRMKAIPIGKPKHVWDVFRFFATKFTAALLDWQIADKKKLEFMAYMKDQRSKFDEMPWAKVKTYCQEEVVYLAQLVRKLFDAHSDIGLDLKQFFGAGSTASAFLKKIQIDNYRSEPPEEAQWAVSRAFFGGRFETSHVGPQRGEIFNYDISSAYPYQATRLPCLLCGRWEKAGKSPSLRRKVERANLALVHVTSLPEEGAAWGPFPWRSSEGTITFPIANPGVWVWGDEAMAADEGWQVRFHEAWLYHTDCDCKPFGDVPKYYLERLKLGKESKGIVLKLGLNSIYGKLAQSRGKAPFNSWVWAGAITSGTRAQLLRAIMAAKDRWNVLMVATDGIWSRKPLALPAPVDTGTQEGGKPLGGWECQIEPRGVFLCRPGIYFPLEPTAEDIKKIKARGIAKGLLLEHADRIVQWWHERDWHRRQTERYEFSGLVRFVGAKTGIGPGVGGIIRAREEFGEWVDLPFDLSFQAAPKRAAMMLDRLLPWATMTGPSAPYRAAVKGPEGQELQQWELEQEEQPDGDIVLA